MIVRLSLSSWALQVVDEKERRAVMMIGSKLNDFIVLDDVDYFLCYYCCCCCIIFFKIHNDKRWKPVVVLCYHHNESCMQQHSSSSALRGGRVRTFSG